MDDPTPSAASVNRADARLSIVLAIMLAGLGLMGALIAWRVGSSSDIASGATLSGLIATRARAAESASAQSLVSQTSDAWLAYEAQRLRAESLRADGFPDAALEAAKRASANWFLVHPEYLDKDGNYDAESHRAALMAEAESGADLDPAPHFALAEREEARVRSLLLVGILLASALPLLTVAEVTGGRRRRVAAVGGLVFFVIGTIAMVGVWL
jgi:hypothetical protein